MFDVKQASFKMRLLAVWEGDEVETIAEDEDEEGSQGGDSELDDAGDGIISGLRRATCSLITKASHCCVQLLDAGLSAKRLRLVKRRAYCLC